jgi:UDP-glucose 4-epimerase
LKILITGANGYLGARLCQFLSNQGHDIIAACKAPVPFTAGLTDKIKKIIIGDLILDKIINKLAETKPNIIIHLVSLNKRDSEKSIDNALNINVRITWKLLEKFSNLELKKFIYMSTIHVGDHITSSSKSDHIYKPGSIYALTHLMSEEICNYYNRKTKTECINIRLSNSYGEPILKNTRCWELILNELVLMAYKKNRVVLNSDGSSLRNFIHYTELCKSIQSLINPEHQSIDKFILIQSNEICSLLELALKIKSVFYKRYNKKIPIFINKGKLFIDNTQDKSIKNKLNSFQYLESGINDLFIYLENNC